MLKEQELDITTTASKLSTMRTLGVPDEEGYEESANDDLMKQAEKISDGLIESGVIVEPQKEIVALIAYLQRLGTDIKTKKTN